MALYLSVFLFCVGIMAYTYSGKFVTEIISSAVKKSLKVSPDSKRVAYAAGSGNKWFVVVNGKEGKQYDDALVDYCIFSPDSKRVACVVSLGQRIQNVIGVFWQFVIADGKEGKHYLGIIGDEGGKFIVFDTALNLRYLARNGHSRWEKARRVSI